LKPSQVSRHLEKIPCVHLEERAIAVPMAQPESHGAWKSATEGLLGNAKSVTGELFAALQDKDVRPPVSPTVPRAYVAPGPRSKADLDATLSVTRQAINTIDTAIMQTSQAMIRLGHEQQNKWAPLKVCEWRTALRDRRPPRELFKDHVSEALEKEMQALIDARAKLKNMVGAGKAIVEDGEANKARLTRNLRHMTMLGSTNLSLIKYGGESGESPPSPSSPSSPAPEAGTAEGDENAAKAPPAVPSDTAGLVRRAPQIKEESIQYCNKVDAAIKRQRDRCEQCREEVMKGFRRRMTENQAVKKTLQAQIQEMEGAIEAAEKSLTAMKKRIDHYGEVALQPKYDAATEILAKLRVSKATLEDDFHHKLVSMKIDDSCRKITAEKTATPPDSLPVMAMLQGPAKKNNLNRNNSSPAFVGGGRERPASPAGVSSPLKAAGAMAMT
jgi:hypothetical protein